MTLRTLLILFVILSWLFAGAVYIAVTRDHSRKLPGGVEVVP